MSPVRTSDLILLVVESETGDTAEESALRLTAHLGYRRSGQPLGRGEAVPRHRPRNDRSRTATSGLVAASTLPLTASSKRRSNWLTAFQMRRASTSSQTSRLVPSRLPSPTLRKQQRPRYMFPVAKPAIGRLIPSDVARPGGFSRSRAVRPRARASPSRTPTSTIRTIETPAPTPSTSAATGTSSPTTTMRSTPWTLGRPALSSTRATVPRRRVCSRLVRYLASRV